MYSRLDLEHYFWNEFSYTVSYIESVFREIPGKTPSPVHRNAALQSPGDAEQVLLRQKGVVADFAQDTSANGVVASAAHSCVG